MDKKTYRDGWYRERKHAGMLIYLHDQNGVEQPHAYATSWGAWLAWNWKSRRARARLCIWVGAFLFVDNLIAIYTIYPIGNGLAVVISIMISMTAWLLYFYGMETFIRERRRRITMAKLRRVSNIECTKDDMPILAHRKANLEYAAGRWQFSSVVNNLKFGKDSKAECSLSLPHKAPDLNCQCGFYAVPADMVNHFGYEGVNLQVELSGRVIEHELGYRAEHQRVISWEPPICSDCYTPAYGAIVDIASLSGYYGRISWACKKHLFEAQSRQFETANKYFSYDPYGIPEIVPMDAMRATKIYTLDKISKALGVPHDKTTGSNI